MSARPATACVFAGGSSLGCVQVGMLKALSARGIMPDFVVGSSAGAINAVHFAADPTREGIGKLESIWCGLNRSDIFPVSRLGGLVGLLRERAYLVEPHGRYLIDGGVANHTPISAALDLDAQVVYVLPTGDACALTAPPRSAIGAALHGLNLLIARQLVTAVRQLAAHADIRVVPPLCPLGVLQYDFNTSPELIDRAEHSTLDWLEQGTEMVDGVPHQLPPHVHDDEVNPYGPHGR